MPENDRHTIVVQTASDPIQEMISTLMSMGMLMGMVVILPLLSSLGQAVGGPTEGFKDLLATYWSDTVGPNAFPPGSKLDVADGAAFGGTVTFRHKGPAQDVQAGFWCNVDGVPVWAGPVAVSVAEDADWTDYSVDVSGTFQRLTLGHCRNVSVVKEIQDAGGATILSDPDADCYHVVTTLDFDLPEDVTQYAVDEGAWHTSPAGSPAALPVADGSIVHFRVVFRHKGIPATVRPVMSIDIGTGCLLYQGAPVALGNDAAWTEYTQDISGAFNTGGGPTGRLLSCVRTLFDSLGNTLKSNEDKMVFSQVPPYGTIPGHSLDLQPRYANVWTPTDADWVPPAAPSLDVVSGVTPVSLKARFAHTGPGGYVFLVMMLDRAGYWQWFFSEPILLGYDDTERIYEAKTVPGAFWNYYWYDSMVVGPLVPVGRRIRVRKAIYAAIYNPTWGHFEVGEQIPGADNEDADVFRLAG